MLFVGIRLCQCGRWSWDTDWTADEVAVLVGSYFLMLAEERAGHDYNKSEYHRSVIAAIGRKPGSIERKEFVVGFEQRSTALNGFCSFLINSAIMLWAEGVSGCMRTGIFSVRERRHRSRSCLRPP
jgi:hypothetical protein